LERKLADPAVHADQALARRFGRRYAELSQIAETARQLEATQGDLATARELAGEDASFAAEATELATREGALQDKLRELLLPRDPNDGKDVILQVKAGEGGEESAAVRRRPAPDVPRVRRAAGLEDRDPRRRAVRPRRLQGRDGRGPRPADSGVWRKLKYEGGVHRVQRVPATESQGRIHTSAGRRARAARGRGGRRPDRPGRPAHRRLPLVRPGGQSVNTTDSAVRITHRPTGTVVSMQNEKSQLQNREAGLRVLRSRLLALAQEEADKEAADARRSQVRTVDRSERVRTYNFPENRISDHRVGYKAYNLDQVLDGNLDDVVAALEKADTEALLGAAGD
jgi:peptide chain release factor 1